MNKYSVNVHLKCWPITLLMGILLLSCGQEIPNANNVKIPSSQPTKNLVPKSSPEPSLSFDAVEINDDRISSSGVDVDTCTMFQESLEPETKKSFESLLTLARFETMRCEVLTYLSSIERQEQRSILLLAENLLTSREYNEVHILARLKSFEILTMSPKETRLSLVDLLRKTSTKIDQHIYANWLTVAMMAPTARIVDMLNLLQEMANYLVYTSEQKYLVQTLLYGPVTEDERIYNILKILWLSDDESSEDLDLEPGFSLVESLAHLVVGCAEDPGLSIYLDKLLALRVKKLRSVAYGLAAFTCSRRSSTVISHDHLGDILYAPDPEFIARATDIGRLFQSFNQPEILDDIFRLNTENKIWRTIIFLLGKYHGDTQVLHQIAELPIHNQLPVLERAINYLRRENPKGVLTTKIINHAAKSCIDFGD